MGTRGGRICECKGSEVGTSLGHTGEGGGNKGEEGKSGGLRSDTQARREGFTLRALGAMVGF